MYNWPANEFLSLPYPNSQLANQKAALLFWGAKNVLSKTKLQDARQLRRQVLERSDWNNGISLDFGNFENETPNKRVKKMSEEELDRHLDIYSDIYLYFTTKYK